MSSLAQIVTGCTLLIVGGVLFKFRDGFQNLFVKVYRIENTTENRFTRLAKRSSFELTPLLMMLFGLVTIGSGLARLAT